MSCMIPAVLITKCEWNGFSVIYYLNYSCHVFSGSCGYDSFLIFPWPWWFWSIVARYFVDCPLVCICLMFFAWWHWVYGFWGEIAQRWNALLMSYQWENVIHMIASDTSFCCSVVLALARNPGRLAPMCLWHISVRLVFCALPCFVTLRSQVYLVFFPALVLASSISLRNSDFLLLENAI